MGLNNITSFSRAGAPARHYIIGDDPDKLMTETDPDKLREAVEPYLAEHGTEEAREVIEEKGSGSHVYEIWEDGEITSTKGGRVFRQRTLHQRVRPIFSGEALWEVPDGQNHKSKVVTDDEKFREIINEHTDANML